MIGGIILYRPAHATALHGELWPGIITQVHKTADDRVDLTVFTSSGVIHMTRVPYSGDPTKENVWMWAEQPKRRPLKEEAPATVGQALAQP